jgi:hypothetical protein
MPQTYAKPVFLGFDPHAPVNIYRRHLPHWRQDGATYFVTFRLGDSIPEQVLLQWQDEDRVWLKANGIGGSPSDPKWQTVYDALPEKARTDFERRAVRRLHIGLDECHGSCLLRNPDAREVVSGSLGHFQGERWWTGDFVVMPNHVHGLFQPTSGYELEKVLGSVKGFVSTRLTKQGVKEGNLWQQENYDRLVRDREELDVWRRYIRGNPDKARIAKHEFTLFRCDWLDEA